MASRSYQPWTSSGQVGQIKAATCDQGFPVLRAWDTSTRQTPATSSPTWSTPSAQADESLVKTR